jgi:hypothetical protein
MCKSVTIIGAGLAGRRKNDPGRSPGVGDGRIWIVVRENKTIPIYPQFANADALQITPEILDSQMF